MRSERVDFKGLTLEALCVLSIRSFWFIGCKALLWCQKSQQMPGVVVFLCLLFSLFWHRRKCLGLLLSLTGLMGKLCGLLCVPTLSL